MTGQSNFDFSIAIIKYHFLRITKIWKEKITLEHHFYVKWSRIVVMMNILSLNDICAISTHPLNVPWNMHSLVNLFI